MRSLVAPVVRTSHVLRETGVLFRSGVLAVGRPDRVVGQLRNLARFGPTLAGAYAAAAVRAPDSIAVTDGANGRTYLELDQRVQALARGLASFGVGPQGSLALLGHNSVAFVETLVATSRLGADALLLNTFMSAQQVREVLEREKPRLVVVDPDQLALVPDLPEGLPLVLMGPAADRAAPTLDEVAGSGAPEPARTKQRGRLVVLTSGTTGAPKGARRPAPSSLSPAASMLSRLRLRRGDSIMIASPLFHTWGLGLLQIAPALAATVVLRRRADPEQVLEAMARAGCTALIAVPVILDRILQLPAAVRQAHDVSRLRVVASSGSALPAALSMRFQKVFGPVLYNIYGSTEISWATIATPEDLTAAPGTAGKPPLGTRLVLLDEEGTPVSHGQVGQIFVGNELLFEGYTNGSDKERWHELMATGDRGYLDPGKRLMVVGRADDLVITGGEKVYPLEVEEVLISLPGVREVAVVGRADAEMGQRLVAYVACDPGTELVAEQIRDHVRSRLARYAVPKDVVFLESLPRTPTGKVVPRLLPPAGSGEPVS